MIRLTQDALQRLHRTVLGHDQVFVLTSRNKGHEGARLQPEFLEVTVAVAISSFQKLVFLTL